MVDDGGLPSSLDSKLLTSGAPFLHQLTVDEAAMAVPGLATFGHEAVRLGSLSVLCSWYDAAAKVGCVFRTGGFSSITKLVYKGSKAPVDLPSGLQHLEVDLCRLLGESLPVDELICSLSQSGLALQSLSINAHYQNVLCSTQVLPPLQDLHIQMTLTEHKILDLDWLRRQQTQRLHLAIAFDPHELAKHHAAWHASAVSQLQRLQLHELRLKLWCPFTFNVQQVWQPLQLQGLLHLSLKHGLVKHKLSLLPSAPQLHISVEDVMAGRPVYIDWDAVTSRPGSVRITLHALQLGCVLAVSGCWGQTPFQASMQPWQFCVHGNVFFVRVAGLPPSQPCTRANFLLQNSAAVAADWTEDT